MSGDPETTGPEQERDDKGRFVPGVSGNPAGRPKGARHKLSEDFFRDMAEAWANGGKQALAEMIAERPHEFVKTAAGLQTKEHSGPDGEQLYAGLNINIRD